MRLCGDDEKAERFALRLPELGNERPIYPAALRMRLAPGS